MRISGEGKIGLGLALTLGVTAGAIEIWPDIALIGWATITLCVIGGIFLADHHFTNGRQLRWTKGNRPRMITFVGMVVGALIFIVSASFYFSFQKNALTTTNPSPTQVSSNIAGSDAAISIQCDNAFLPDRIPAEGSVLAIELLWNAHVPHQGGQNRKFYGAVDQPLSWFSEGKAQGVYRCQIFNDGSGPILNIFLEFEVEFRNQVLTGNSQGVIAYSGEVVGKGKVNIRAPRVDVGKNGVFTFYIYNASLYDATIKIPRIAVAGADEFGSGGQKINVIPTSNEMLFFAAFSK